MTGRKKYSILLKLQRQRPENILPPPGPLNHRAALNHSDALQRRAVTHSIMFSTEAP